MHGFWILLRSHWALSLQIMVLTYGLEMSVEHVGVMAIYHYLRMTRYLKFMLQILSFNDLLVV